MTRRSPPATPDTDEMLDQSPPGFLKSLGFILGPALFLFIYFFLRPEGMSADARAVLASTAWMAAWWITEPIPIPATSLMPVVLFPTLGVSNVKAVAAPYADPTVFLFLGGFLVAMAVERWKLHRRIALGVISFLGVSPGKLVAGFLLSTAVLSMWLSNTATAMMMLPIGVAVAAQLRSLQATGSAPDPEQERSQANFGTALMLAIAYGASVGGVGTLIGTPPNAIMKGMVAELLGQEIGFAQWMLLAVPLMALTMAATWLILMRIFPSKGGEIPGGRELIRTEVQALGPMSTEERRALLVFLMVSFLWVARPYLFGTYLPNVDDSVIAIFGGLSLFLIPTGRRGQYMLSVDAIFKVPWGILLLFGAGFSLAQAFGTSGLSAWLGNSLTALQGVGYFWILVASVTLVIFLTEVTSNSAVATLMMPIMASLGSALQVSPLALMVGTALAASYAFMLPVATPPNAIVFASGHVTIAQMARAGLWLNLIGIVLIILTVYFWMPIVW